MDAKQKLMHLFLFTNSAQRELISICTQSKRNCINFPCIITLRLDVLDRIVLNWHIHKLIMLLNVTLVPLRKYEWHYPLTFPPPPHSAPPCYTIQPSYIANLSSWSEAKPHCKMHSGCPILKTFYRFCTDTIQAYLMPNKEDIGRCEVEGRGGGVCGN